MKFDRWNPPGLILRLTFVGFALVIRWLFGSLSGIFVLSTSLYFALLAWGQTQPFLPHQLVLWLDSLPTESRTAIFTSLLTIVGFLVAFVTATLNWKHQARAALMLQVASELQTKFTEIGRVAQRLSLYAESQIEALNKLQTEGATAGSIFAIRYQVENIATYRADQKQFSEHAVAVHDFTGRYGLVLSQLGNAFAVLESAISRVTSIADAMWINLPHVSVDDPQLLNRFASVVEIDEWQRLVDTCKSATLMHREIGEIRGRLLTPTLDFTLRQLWTLTRSKSMRHALAVKDD